MVVMAQHREEIAMRDSMSIHFPVSKWNLLHDFNGNAAQLDSIRNLFTSIRGDSLYRINHISIIGGASPDGGLAFNKTLSEKRAKTLFSHLRQYGVEDMEMDFTFLGRDWQGVAQLAQNDPDLPFAEETIALLQKIAGEKQATGREPSGSLLSIKRLHEGVPYSYLLKNVFPKVRASKVILEYSKIPYQETPEPVIAEEDTTHIVVVAEDYENPSDTIAVCEETIVAPSSEESADTVTEEVNVCKPFYMDIRSNMLYDALLLPNIGVVFYLGKNLSVGANWMYGWWSNAEKFRYWRAYGGEVTGRWWFGGKAHEKPLTGHHVGIYGQMYTYDFQVSAKGEMGGKPGGTLWDQFMWGAGVEYGYSLPVSRRINIDFSLGLGYTTGLYNEYKHVDDCNVWQRTKRRRYFGPSKLEISFVWLLGCDNYNRRRQKGGVK